jgi:hypothetical protein
MLRGSAGGIDKMEIRGFSLPVICSIINGRLPYWAPTYQKWKRNQEEYHVRFKVCKRKS